MCLGKISPVKIADKDIICYKVLIKNFNITKSLLKYISPYVRTIYEAGKCYTVSNFNDNETNSVAYGIHTFKTLGGARSLCEELACLGYRGELIYIHKMIIPEGSKYYEGYSYTNGRKYKGFASEQIFFPVPSIL